MPRQLERHDPGRRANDAARRRAALLSASGILAALGAASCCIVPFTLFMLGVSGAWIGHLTALAPFQPLFAAAAFGFIGYGAFLLHRRPQATCAEASVCGRLASARLAKIGLWIAGALVLVAVGFPYLILVFLPS